jgi:hypothetical protein
MSFSSLRALSGYRLVFLAAFLATVLKAAWVVNSSGSSDSMLFFIYGKEFSHSTLAHMYGKGPIFNHTPLTAYLMAGLYNLSQGDYFTFAAGLRFLSIFADLGLIALLVSLRNRTGQPPWWALVLFAASPVSLMISGFHGNIDPLLVLGLFGAAYALVLKKPLLAGALFALSANIKIVPLLLAPVFFFYLLKQGWRPLLTFCAAAAVVMVLGAAQPLLQCPALYLKNVYGYGSYFGTWGFTYWLHELGGPAYRLVSFIGLSAEQQKAMSILKAVMILCVVAFAWRRRGVQGPAFLTSLTAAFVCIFIFAPGVGPQYLVWFAPFLLWSSPRWFAVITACCTAYMISFYHPSSKFSFPWELAIPTGPEIVYWGPWMNLPWLAFITLLVVNTPAWARTKPIALAVEPVSEANLAQA